MQFANKTSQTQTSLFHPSLQQNKEQLHYIAVLMQFLFLSTIRVMALRWAESGYHHDGVAPIMFRCRINPTVWCKNVTRQASRKLKLVLIYFAHVASFIFQEKMRFVYCVASHMCLLYDHCNGRHTHYGMYNIPPRGGYHEWVEPDKTSV